MYKGSSDGFADLQRDYMAYAEEVNLRRAVPDVRDGLKPVQRRILQALNDMGSKTMDKSSTLVGQTAKYHPHGDSSAYEAMVLMTDRNGSWNVPLIEGQGDWGAVYSSDDAAAPRYTEGKLGDWAQDFLEDLEFVKKVPKESTIGTEAEVLPCRYPFILTVGHKGVGVGVSSFIPPFNFWEVIELTKYYLKNGTFDDLAILPDFPTGGVIVEDQVEALKMMYSGKGKYINRATYEVHDSLIEIHEVPYETTSDSIVQAINDIEHDTLEFKAFQGSDLKRGCNIQVICYKGTDPSDVEVLLYKKGILQKTHTPYMLWVTSNEDGGDVLREGGVYSIIEEFLKFRRGVLSRRFESDKAALEDEIKRLSYFIELVEDIESRDKYLDLVVNYSSMDAREFLVERFPETEEREAIPEDIIKWIYSRRVSAFNRANVYRERIDNLRAELDRVITSLGDLDQVIYDDLTELEKEHEGHHYRKTELSSTKVVATKIKKKAKKDPGEFCYFRWNPTAGTIVKSRNEMGSDDTVTEVTGNSQKTLLFGLGIDGTLAKIWASDLEFEMPISVTELCGLDAPVIEVVHSQSSPRVLIFTDGSVSFWDPSTDVSTRKTKLKRNTFPELYNLAGIQFEKDLESVTWAWKDDEGDLCGCSALISDMDRPKQSRTRSYFVNLEDVPEYMGINVDRVVRYPEVLHNGYGDPDWENSLISIQV